MRPASRTVYALYKGDTFRDLGTLNELAERVGITRETMKYYTSKAYQRKLERRNTVNSTIVIKIEDDEDE